MSRRQIIFIVSVVWFFAWIPAGWFWGWHPIRWLDEPCSFRDVEAVSKTFPIHFASLPPSAISRHNQQLAEEDASVTPEFDPFDWAFREMRYRCGLCFIAFIVSTICMRWFLSQIVMGKTTWSD